MAVGGAQSGPLWARGARGRRPAARVHQRLWAQGSPRRGSRARRGTCARLGQGSGHRNLLPKRVSHPDICAESPQPLHYPRTPQVNWGARACNTYNEVSVALAKFNYGCICFLIFPRWFDLKGGKKHPKLQRNRLHSSFLQKVRNPDHFFQTPAFSRCVRIHRVAAEARYYSE